MKASPLTVFLTILIILTAVIGLYTYLTPPMDGQIYPKGSFSGVQKASSTTENVFFGPFSEDVKPQEIYIIIMPLYVAGWSSYSMPSTGLSGPLALVVSNNMSEISGVTYTDLAQDTKISDGDYITMTFVHPGSEFVKYLVVMVSVPYGEDLDRVTFFW